MQLFSNRVNEADLGSLYINVTNAENQQRNWFLCRLLLLFFWSLVKRLVWCSCPQPSSILRRPLHLWIMAPIHIHLNLLMYPSCGLPLWLHPPPPPTHTLPWSTNFFSPELCSVHPHYDGYTIYPSDIQHSSVAPCFKNLYPSLVWTTNQPHFIPKQGYPPKKSIKILPNT